MSNPQSGRWGAVKMGTVTVALQAKFDLDESSEELDGSVFGTGWGSTTPGQQKWKCTMDGFLADDDVTGQNALKTAKRQGTLVTNLRFYYTSTHYMLPDITTDPTAGCYVLGRKIGVPNNGLVTVGYTIGGVGPVTEVTP